MIEARFNPIYNKKEQAMEFAKTVDRLMTPMFWLYRKHRGFLFINRSSLQCGRIKRRKGFKNDLLIRSTRNVMRSQRP